MTLKQKINDCIITNIEIRESENRMYYEYNHLELAEECEEIADNFAIGFLQFTEGTYSYSNIFDNWYLHANTSIRYTPKELLEIYKKENGL